MPTKESIEESLQRIRPFLEIDGGNVEFVRMTDDGIMELRLTGSCLHCPMSLMTLRAGIERAILREHSDVRRVEQVQ